MLLGRLPATRMVYIGFGSKVGGNVDEAGMVRRKGR